MITGLQPYPAMKPSDVEWLGDVPEHWDVRRLKTALARNDSGVWGDDADSDGGTVVLRSTEQTIDGGWAISHPARRTLSSREKAGSLLAVGDLVVTKSSGSESHIGKTSLVTDHVAQLGACFSNFMQRFRCLPVLEPRLAWYVLNSRVGRQQLVFNSNTTTGLANLNGTILGDVLLPIPPLNEQAAIVRYLDHVDRRISRYIRAKQRLIELLEEEKQAIIHGAVTRGLDPDVRLKPSGAEWLGDIPEHWDVRRLKTILAERVTDGPHSTPTFLASGVPFLSVDGIQAGELVFENCRYVSLEDHQEFARKAAPRHGDILLGKAASTGKIARVKVDFEFSIWSPLALIRPSHSLVLPGFLEYALKDVSAQDQVEMLCTLNTQRNISMADIPRLILALPPVREQATIVRYLESETGDIDAAVDRARNGLELLREYRTRLIADVVTGKLDVRAAPADLPESDAADIEGTRGIDDAADDEFSPALKEIAT